MASHLFFILWQQYSEHSSHCVGIHHAINLVDCKILSHIVEAWKFQYSLYPWLRLKSGPCDSGLDNLMSSCDFKPLLSGTKMMVSIFNNSTFTVSGDNAQWWGQYCLMVWWSPGCPTSAATLVSFHFVGLVFKVFVDFVISSINYLLIKTTKVSFCCLHLRTLTDMNV